MTFNEDADHYFEGWRQRIESLISDHPLQIISWEATRRCNLRCVHCGSPAEAVNLKDELTTSEVIGAFEQIANDFDMGQFRHINITGGEPFVRSDLLDILQAIQKWPFYRNIDIQTNGIYIAENPGVLEKLKHVGVTGLGISIDGLETTHDSFRRIPGGFKQSFNAAKLAVEHGYTVTISVVAHAKNIHEIPELFERTQKEIHPRVFRIMTIDPIGRMEHDLEYLLSPQQTKEVIEFLQKEYTKNCDAYADKKTTMVELGCGGWLGTELEGTIRPFIFHCIAGLNNLGILYDGKLGSCSNISRDFIEGDLRSERIQEVWENRYDRYRNFEWKKTGICKDCDEWGYCHGGPMHLAGTFTNGQSCLHKKNIMPQS